MSTFSFAIRPVMMVAVALGLFGCARSEPAVEREPLPGATERRAADPPTEKKATESKTPDTRRMYRLDFTLTSTLPGKAPNSSAYAMNVRENDVGEIHLGSNVPLSVAPPARSGAAPSEPRPMVAPRVDVGVKLESRFVMSGADLIVHDDLEMSSADALEVVTIHKIVLRGEALVSPGKGPAVVSISEDPTTHQRYELTVAAKAL